MGGDGISLDPHRAGHESDHPIIVGPMPARNDAPSNRLDFMDGEGRSRDEELSIGELVDLFLDPVYRFAFRLTGSSQDADDLAQETFLIAQQNLHQLRDRRAALPWLFRILRSCRARYGRRLPMEPSIEIEEIVDASEGNEDIDELDTERLFGVLGTMPDEYREPLLLYYFEELSYREIAQALECPMGTVMSRISRGKAFLRSRLVPASCAKED